MQFHEKFSNTEIVESVKGEAIKQGTKKAARHIKIAGKKAIKKAKKYLNQHSTKGAAIGAGIGLGAAAIHKAKNESLSSRLNTYTIRLGERSQVLNTFKDHKGIYQLDIFKNRAKNFLSSPRVNNRTTIASALLVGGVGISLLLNKAKEKGANETIWSIRRASSKVQKSNKYTSTQKAKIRNSAELAINRIKQIFNKKK